MTDTFNLLVCGAGCAGFCAAVAAARLGARVALAERYHTPGGILTVLGSQSVDQFNNPFLPRDKMIIDGIGWELIRRLHRDGFAVIPDMDAPYEHHWQYGVKVNPVAAAKVMDDMLLESGVTLFYGQPVADAETEGGRIRSVRILTAAGLRRLSANVYLDCTGDGMLAALCGAAFWAGDGNGAFQPGTLRYYPAGAPALPVSEAGDNRNHVSYNPTDSAAITAAEVEGRRMLYRQMQQGTPMLAAAPAVAPREGRRICGRSVLNVRDFCEGRIFPDSVCYSYWFIDIHRDGMPAEIRYLRSERTPTIRLSALMARDTENLMMAGRCLSSDREANSALRVKASCMASGQAAGTAAALAVRAGVLPGQLDPEAVRQALNRAGAIVPGLTPTRTFRDRMAPL